MLEQFGLPLPGEDAQAADDPQDSQVAAALAIDSAEIQDSVAAAQTRDSIAAAAAARDSATRDSLAEVRLQLAAAQRRNQRQTTQTPPARQAPRPQFGTISVNVLGNFGNVYIDDASVGRTPLFEHRVAAGRHVVRITRQGCQDRVDTLRVAVDETVRHTVPLTCGG